MLFDLLDCVGAFLYSPCFCYVLIIAHFVIKSNTFFVCFYRKWAFDICFGDLTEVAIL